MVADPIFTTHFCAISIITTQISSTRAFSSQARYTVFNERTYYIQTRHRHRGIRACRRYRFGVHNPVYCKLVRRLDSARVRPTELDIRSSLDDTLRAHGHRRVSGMEKGTGEKGRKDCSRYFWRSTGP